MKSRNIANHLMILSMFVFGTLPLFVRKINVNSGELALYRALLASAIIGVFLLIKKQKLFVNCIKKELLLLLLSGVAMGINWIFLFQSYKYTTISIATLCYYFAPIIVMITSPLLFKENLTKKQTICFIVSTIGLVMITSATSGGSKDILGIVFGLSAAVFYSIVIVINKLITNITGLHRTFIQFVSAIIILAPYVVFSNGFTIKNINITGWGALLIVGIIHTGIAYCMYFTAIKKLPGQKVAILSYIDPLIAVIISVALLNEEISIPQIIGGILILGFTLYNELTT